MRSDVLEIAEKARKLSHRDLLDLIGLLEDMEDNAAADAALADGDFISQEEHFADRRGG